MLTATLMAAVLAATPQDPSEGVADAKVAPAADQAATEAAAEDDDKPICITHAQLGTRFKKKTCYTKTEYERRQLEERQTLQRIQRIPLRGE